MLSEQQEAGKPLEKNKNRHADNNHKPAKARAILTHCCNLQPLFCILKSRGKQKKEKNEKKIVRQSVNLFNNGTNAHAENKHRK